MLWRVIEFQALQDAMRLRRGEGLVECPGAVGWKVVQHDAYPLRVEIMGVDQITHTAGIVFGSPAVGHLHMAPGSVREETPEQIGRAVAAVFVVEAFSLAGLRRDRLAHLADQLHRASIEANHRALRIRFFGAEVEHIPQSPKGEYGAKGFLVGPGRAILRPV